MYVVHANWSGEALYLWAESLERWRDRDRQSAGSDEHSHASDPSALAEALGLSPAKAEYPSSLALRLPVSEGVCLPSPELAHRLGRTYSIEGASLATVSTPAVCVPAEHAAQILERLTDLEERAHSNGSPGMRTAASAEWFAVLSRFAGRLLAQQRVVPSLRQASTGELLGVWQPWASEEPYNGQLTSIVASMPPSARAVEDELSHDAWLITERALTLMIDVLCRRSLAPAELAEAVAERDGSDLHVAWLKGLLGDERRAPTQGSGRADLVRGVREWLRGLERRGPTAGWEIVLRLEEPTVSPGGRVEDGWALRFLMRCVEEPELEAEAEALWLLPGDSAMIQGRRIDHPKRLILSELERVARLYPPVERAATSVSPEPLELSTVEAYRFLRDVRPALVEQGISVEVPGWWDSRSSRLGVRLRVGPGAEAAPLGDVEGTGQTSAQMAAGSRLGLETLVSFGWEITLGGSTLSMEEFERLASMNAPLIQIDGRWVEIRPEDASAAASFMRANPDGTMSLGRALSLAFGVERQDTGLPVVDIETEGWVGSLLDGTVPEGLMPDISQPLGFEGSLRPYQERGLSWLSFLDRLGLGACLADDMGLGKTIQLLALLQHEREVAKRTGENVPPTLIVVPMSVVGNWAREADRFCPGLRVLLHHGPERSLGEAFAAQSNAHDVVITTYGLAHRDHESLANVVWRRVVLDEAQYVKNARTKQSAAVRSLVAQSRVALTGTPVENDLMELWSIMEFLNPGFLGGESTFRRRFAAPIERNHDAERSERLRGLIRPFVLRRLKSDPAVAVDLPKKIESREYVPLTPEQGALYESHVSRMLAEVDRTEGMQRRGLVLATLVRLKQICNHPSHLLRDWSEDQATTPDPARSGKCVRLIEMLQEVLAEREQALVFTQFRQMALLLASMLRHELDREILVLHGGLGKAERERVVQTFQEADQARPILLASLKAGGVGLNLTAATHVFHFDRWWNPAVENQATDRAYRIGQTQRVLVHKFVVRGTLEERIDEMISQKVRLSEQIIGSGERWLTELSTDQLRDMLALRSDAIDEEAA